MKTNNTQPKISSDDAIVDTKECKDCGRTFDVTDGERKFYKQMGWPEPARCYTCRKARKVSYRQ